MSRRYLKPRKSYHEVVVGWDPPLQTFFVQVRDLRPDQRFTGGVLDDLVLWKGASAIGEICDVDELIAVVAPYAFISPWMRESLLHDKTENRG